jgi:hypothetical protein
MDNLIDISSSNWSSSENTSKHVNLSNTESSHHPPSASSNFGGGVELLMNDKKKHKQESSSIGIDDLTDLENELNDLVNLDPSKLNDYGFSAPKDENIFESSKSSQSVKFDSTPLPDEKTWDGYGKYASHINPDQSQSPHVSKDEVLKEKFRVLKKLETLESKGIQLTKKYNMESSLAEMQTEYEIIVDEKTKTNSVKFQGNMLMAAINAIEFLNNRYDPFDIKIDGWSEQVNENLTDYDDIFGELYEKYKTKAAMSPELKLMFQLGGSAMMVHMTNTMFKSSVPGMDDILRQNPDLMKQFQSAAVNTMGQSNPGLAGFMGGLMNPQGPPPPPINTQDPGSYQPSNARQGNNMYGSARPDLNSGKGNNYPNNDAPAKSKRPVRSEMNGPSDISQVLAGLKTKTATIPSAPSNPVNYSNNNSTISFSDLKDLSDMPKPVKSRRKKSDKNTISLDF